MAFEPTATVMRPTSFHDLAGQEFVASTLTYALSEGRIAPAYLFSGPRGVGKTSAARILAKALNCEAGLTGVPCGTCSSCVDISRSSAMDVLEIDGASNTSVNDVREIKDEVLFAPSEGRYKVYIIDEVHMLSNSAFNALLKTIEEPPPYVVFVFATTEIHKVPATIRSRCQQFHFRLIPQETIESHLTEVAKKSGFTAEPEAIRWIAREAAGSMRDAYTLFDQVAAFSQGSITMEETRQKLKLMGSEKVAQILEHLVRQEVLEALSLVENELNKGVEVERFATELAQYLRMLLLVAHGVTSETILTQPIGEIPKGVREIFTPPQIEVALDLSLSLFRNIRYSLNQRYELELLLIRISTLPQMASSEELVERLELLKDEIQQGSVGSVPAGSAPVTTPVTQSATGASALGSSVENSVDTTKPREITKSLAETPLGGANVRLDASVESVRSDAPALGKSSSMEETLESATPQDPTAPQGVDPSQATTSPQTGEPSVLPVEPTSSAESIPTQGKLTREQWMELTGHIGDDLALKALLGKILAQKYDDTGFYVLVSGVYEQKQLTLKAAQIEDAVAKVLGSRKSFHAKLKRKETPAPVAESQGDPQAAKKSEDDPLELVKDVFRGTIIES